MVEACKEAYPEGELGMEAASRTWGPQMDITSTGLGLTAIDDTETISP